MRKKCFEIKKIKTDMIRCHFIRNNSVVALAIQDMDELFRAPHGAMNVYMATNGWEVVSKNRPKLYWYQINLRGADKKSDYDICTYQCGNSDQAQEFMQDVVSAIQEWSDAWRKDRLEFTGGG